MENIEEVLGHEIKVNYLPSRSFDVSESVLDNSLALKHLGWKPQVELKEGLRNAAKWMKSQNL